MRFRSLVESPIRHTSQMGQFWVSPQGEVHSLSGDHGWWAIQNILGGDLHEWMRASEIEEDGGDEVEQEWLKEFLQRHPEIGDEGPRESAIIEAIRLGWVRAEIEQAGQLDIEAFTPQMASRAARLLINDTINTVLVSGIRLPGATLDGYYTLTGIDLARFAKSGRLPVISEARLRQDPIDIAIKSLGHRYNGFGGNCASFAIVLYTILQGGKFAVVDSDHYEYVDHIGLAYHGRIYDARGGHSVTEFRRQWGKFELYSPGDDPSWILRLVDTTGGGVWSGLNKDALMSDLKKALRMYRLGETRLNELFTRPVYWIWRKDTPSFRLAEFLVGDNNYHVEFDGDLRPNGISDWIVGFALRRGENQFSMDRTGTGNAFVVLSTVADIVAKFIQEVKPDVLRFTGDEARRRIYAGMGKILTPVMRELGYTMHRNEGDFWVQKSPLGETRIVIPVEHLRPNPRMIALKNPTRDETLRAVYQSEHQENLRGLLVGPDAYFWDAALATHSFFAEAAKLPYDWRYRMYLKLYRDGRAELQFGNEVQSQVLGNPHIQNMLKRGDILFDWGSHGLIRFAEYKQILSGETDQLLAQLAENLTPPRVK